MKKFHFRLEAALTMRRMKEEQALRKYGEAVRLEQQALADCESAKAASLSLAARIEASRAGAFSPALQAACALELEHAQTCIAERSQALNHARAEKTRRLAEAMAARQQAQALERLREKRRRAHETAELRKEELEVEALALASRAAAS